MNEHSEQSYRKLAATLLILGAVLANIAFIGLGSVFNYRYPARAGKRDPSAIHGKPNRDNFLV